MSISILIGAWALGSLLLGLVLGRLFGSFGKRRRAEEELFTRLEDLRVVAALRARFFPVDPRSSPSSFRLSNSGTSLEPDGEKWPLMWAPHHRGGLIQ